MLVFRQFSAKKAIKRTFEASKIKKDFGGLI